MSNPVTDLKRELLAAAERQEHKPATVSERRVRGSARAIRLLPIAAVVAVAAAVALFFTAPWSNSPGFLDRAAAALTPPDGTILHEKFAETTSRIGCTATRTAEIWIDERTHRFRGLFHDPFGEKPLSISPPPPVFKPGCRPETFEAGGVLGPRNALGPDNKLVRSLVLLRFLPKQDKLVRIPPCCQQSVLADQVNPVPDLRRAIRAGLAHLQGSTKLHGRRVERIRIDPCPAKSLNTSPSSCPDLVQLKGGGYAYVDPKTYYPVEIRLAGDVTRFAEYEYLPRTTANLALTNIRAEHPHAQLSNG